MANWKKSSKLKAPGEVEETRYFDPTDDLGGDESRLAVRSAMLEVADNQIRDYAPAREAYERLISEGIHKTDARFFIANLIAQQTAHVMKNGTPFDEEMYLGWLKNLPKLPGN